MKKIIFLSLLIFSQVFPLLAQSHTLLPFYKKGISRVLDMEEGEFEVVRTEFDVLSKDDNIESIRRTFNKEYGYLIIAYADKGLSKLELSVRKDGEEIDNSKVYEDIKKDFFQESEDLDKIAMLILTPEESEEYIINIQCNQFEDNNEAGRYFITIGHTINDTPLPKSDPNILRVSSSSYKSYTKNTKKNKYSWENTKYDKSNIKIDMNVKELTINNRLFNRTYYLTTMKEGEDKKKTVINAQNETGTPYFIEINNELIDIYRKEKKNRTKGTRYIIE